MTGNYCSCIDIWYMTLVIPHENKKEANKSPPFYSTKGLPAFTINSIE